MSRSEPSKDYPYSFEVGRISYFVEGDVVGDWCVKNCKGLWYRDMDPNLWLDVVYIQEDEDAVLFALSWQLQ